MRRPPRKHENTRKTRSAFVLSWFRGWTIGCGDAVPVGTGGGGHESHQGRPAGGCDRQSGPQRGDRRRQRSHRVRRDRRAPGGRGNHRPQPVLGDPRADRSPHAHDVLLGPHARHAAAGPAAAAGGRHGRARRRQRAPDARDRRHDRARPRRVERDRLRDARSDQHGQDGRAADVRRRPGAVGAARRRAEAGLSAAGGGAHRPPAPTGSRSTARAAAIRASTRRRR